LICAEATRLFLVRRFLIHGAARARQPEASCGGMDLCTEATDLSVRSRRISCSVSFLDCDLESCVLVSRPQRLSGREIC
jgi:hypothetical protein